MKNAIKYENAKRKNRKKRKEYEAQFPTNEATYIPPAKFPSVRTKPWVPLKRLDLVLYVCYADML